MYIVCVCMRSRRAVGGTNNVNYVQEQRKQRVWGGKLSDMLDRQVYREQEQQQHQPQDH